MESHGLSQRRACRLVGIGHSTLRYQRRRANDEALDFVSDTLADGRRFRVLCVLDDFSRECLAAVVDTSLGGARVARELEQVVNQRGWPQTIVSDNGTELTSNAVLRWAAERVLLALHPTRQAGAECLHRELQQQTSRRVPQ